MEYWKLKDESFAVVDDFFDLKDEENQTVIRLTDCFNDSVIVIVLAAGLIVTVFLCTEIKSKIFDLMDMKVFLIYKNIVSNNNIIFGVSSLCIR